MKKYVLSSCMVAMSGMACAQSSVTLFGVVDTVVQKGSGSVADTMQMGSGGGYASRLGFRGTEDLGGGLWAGFWLESGVSVNSGAGTTTNTNNQSTGTTGGGGLTFGRRATVSLGGSWGELRLGRDYSPQYYNRFTYDPYGNNGVGASQTNVGSLTALINRVSNSVAYHLPSDLGGVYGVAEYYMGQNASNAGATKNDGTGGGVRLGWKNQAFDVAAAHATTKYATTTTAGNITSTNIGGRYDFNAFSVMGGYFRDKVDTTAGITGKGPQIAGIWRVGVGEVKAMYSSYKTTAVGNPESKKISLGYVHNLSKRTAVYGTYAQVNNSGGATTSLNNSITAANKSSSGFDLGIRHSF